MPSGDATTTTDKATTTDNEGGQRDYSDEYLPHRAGMMHFNQLINPITCCLKPLPSGHRLPPHLLPQKQRRANYSVLGLSPVHQPDWIAELLVRQQIGQRWDVGGLAGWLLNSSTPGYQTRYCRYFDKFPPGDVSGTDAIMVSVSFGHYFLLRTQNNNLQNSFIAQHKNCHPRCQNRQAH